MRILIADDHAIFRRGIKEILLESFPMAFFGEADNSRGVLEKLSKDSWDLLVLDITMPGASGVEVLKQVKKCAPQLPVLMLSAHPEEQYALRVIEAGAAGYLTKMQAPFDLLIAVRKILAGGKYITASLAERLADHMNERNGWPAHERLSNREFEVLRLLASGKRIKGIAQELSVSIQTVSTHRSRILKKLGLRSVSDLVRYAVQNQLVD